ncbi:MAG TPA: hypothetical protein VGM87_10250 [Roseomonas sp.]|jgi:hypothetical protein
MADIAPVLAFPRRDADRLRLAMHGLEAAMVEQARAMAGFRASMTELAGAVDELRHGAEVYQDRLGWLGAQVGQAHAAARQLEGIADRWLRTQG